MTIAIVAEKASAARNMGKALGGMTGKFDRQDYKVFALSGHLYEFADPQDMLRDKSRKAFYEKWSLDNLPWSASDFNWKRKATKGHSDLLKKLKRDLSQASITEIAIATDLDPTGEGDLLFWEVADELNLHHKKFTRMEFTDESEVSIQKAFRSRRSVKSMNDEGAYRMADARAKMDYMTMQYTRIASLNLGSGYFAVLRQGRLKSAMVNLVATQSNAYHNYVKKPYFCNKFEDENGVVYTNVDEPRSDSKDEVPNIYKTSPVVEDSRMMKKQAPGKLLDLAGLSGRLSSQGIKAKEVLAVYQKMYEDQVVSYPRTEDKNITQEQFNELASNIDKIARLVGVDPALLNHRSPRPSHVMNKGAHGANRPGPKVPASLDELKTKYGRIAPVIYEVLARNVLAMFVNDYEYEQVKGHVKDYPAFKGSVNIPKYLGWKAVFDDGEIDENASTKGLGKVAEPFVFEGANKRPARPTMKWLMKQLEKYNVGTGATRTSTYADVTSTKHKFPLLVEEKGILDVTEFGQMSHHLLQDTYIGDLKATEAFYSMMQEIKQGKKTTQDGLDLVSSWVFSDIDTMAENGKKLRKENLMSDDRVEGIFNGKQVRFKKVWSGHEFTADEIEKLLDGQEIEFEAVSKAGKPYFVCGQLAEQTFTSEEGKEIPFVGFKPDFSKAPLPSSFLGHTFSAEERDALNAGEEVFITGLTSKKGKSFDAHLTYKKKSDGNMGFEFRFDD